MFKLHLDLNISIKLSEMLIISFLVFFAFMGRLKGLCVKLPMPETVKRRAVSYKDALNGP